MTAGQPEGVGQQQGQPMTLREEFACRTCGHMHDTDRSCMSNGISESEYCNCDDGEPAPSPTPPVRDSVRDEALHEVECPSCGATIRARMADAESATPTWTREGRMAAGEAGEGLQAAVPRKPTAPSMVLHDFGGRDEARETVARWLVDTIQPHHFTDDGTYDANGNLDAVIDELLALPELDKLLRPPA